MNCPTDDDYWLIYYHREKSVKTCFFAKGKSTSKFNQRHHNSVNKFACRQIVYSFRFLSIDFQYNKSCQILILQNKHVSALKCFLRLTLLGFKFWIKPVINHDINRENWMVRSMFTRVHFLFSNMVNKAAIYCDL